MIRQIFEWVDSHWGDMIGLLVMYTGVFLVVKGWGAHTGEALVLAGMGVLKLKTPNGKNGAPPAP